MVSVRPDQHGKGLGAALVRAVVDDARTLGLPRVIALTREVAFFERSGFVVASRDGLPRKVWVDCVRCPRRHACDEVAVVPPGVWQSARPLGGWVLVGCTVAPGFRFDCFEMAPPGWEP